MRKHLLALVLVGAGIGLAPPNARAAITATLNEFTGADAQITVTIGPAASAGDLQFTLTRVSPSSGDITGFYANLSGAAQTALFNDGPFTVTGTTVAASQFSADAVNNLGNGVNINGGGSPAPMDFGVRFTKPGDGSQGSVTFVLHGAGGSLSESLFADATFAARIQAINGSSDDEGEGSSKLSGTGSPVQGAVPDGSSTATLLGISLCGVEWLRRKLMS